MKHIHVVLHQMILTGGSCLINGSQVCPDKFVDIANNHIILHFWIENWKRVCL